jgi:hypothetical protein
MSSKRSGVYTGMQNKLEGESACYEDVSRYKQQYFLTNQYDIKICLTFVLTSNVHYARKQMKVLINNNCEL